MKNNLQNSLIVSKEAAEKARKWVVVDAKGKTLGRLATEVAAILRGKNKAIFTAHVDVGDYVVVINAGEVKLTGKKMADKLYIHHTGYVGGVKEITAGDLLAKHPTRLVEAAVWGMIPKGPLGRQVFSKLKIYAGAEHPHGAQQAQPYALQYN